MNASCYVQWGRILTCSSYDTAFSGAWAATCFRNTAPLSSLPRGRRSRFLPDKWGGAPETRCHLSATEHCAFFVIPLTAWILGGSSALLCGLSIPLLFRSFLAMLTSASLHCELQTVIFDVSDAIILQNVAILCIHYIRLLTKLPRVVLFGVDREIT